MQLAKKEREQQARIAEMFEERELQRNQESLDEAFKVYTRGFEAATSGDDFARGWESTKVQILGLGAP